MSMNDKDNEKKSHLPQIISSSYASGSNACSDWVGGDSSDRSDNNAALSLEEGRQQCQRQRHLILHFDINETILVGDDAGGDTVDDCINKIIAKSAFVQIPKEDDSGNLDATTTTIRTTAKTSEVIPTHWWDGTPIPISAKCSNCTNRNSNSINHESKSMQQENQEHSPSPPPLYTGWEWPKDTCPYYRTSYKKDAKNFTKTFSNGNIYRPLYEHLQKKIVIGINDNENRNVNENVTQVQSQEKSHPFQRMIPSFFQTLVKLKEENISYTLVLRTFGSDLEDIALAINEFARGRHPLFPNFVEPRLYFDKGDLYKGRWRRKKKKNQEDVCGDPDTDNTSAVFDLYSWDYNDCDEDTDHGSGSDQSPTVVASGDDEVLNIIERSKVCGIQDDYHFWDDNDNAPWAGKPVWIHSTTSSSSSTSPSSPLPPKLKEETPNPSYSCHHLFFDDNIHNDPNDSIVAVRTLRKSINTDDNNEDKNHNNTNIKNNHLTCNFVGSENKWVSLSGLETIEQQGKYVVRVPTVEAILKQDWFIQQIKSAQVKVNDNGNNS